MHYTSNCPSTQSSQTRLFDDMVVSCEDKAFCSHTDDDNDGRVQYQSSSSSSASSSSILSSSVDDWESFTEKNNKEYDSATILDFPFDLLEDDYSTGDILFSLDDILWNDSTDTKDSPLDCAFDPISKQGLSSTVSPPIVPRLNMDKLDECMQRSAESRSMITKMAAAMLPTPWSAFDTMSVISDDSSSVCTPQCPQDVKVNHTSVLPPCTDILSSPSLRPAVPSVESEMMSIQPKSKKGNPKTKRPKKTTRTYKKRSPSEYICSGVLMKRVMPKIMTQDESRDSCSNTFSNGSEATKTMIHKILLQKKGTESVSAVAPSNHSTQSISSFLRQHKKPLYIGGY